jgi:quercetin dioxygenase-like cupin family protein
LNIKQSSVRLIHWQGSQHPSMSVVTREMKKEGLRPYMWENMPNHRYPVRTHGYDKVMYVVEGSVEITFPDFNQRMVLRSGDRIEIPAGIRHGTNIGLSGAKCVEAAVARR